MHPHPTPLDRCLLRRAVELGMLVACLPAAVVTTLSGHSVAAVALSAMAGSVLLMRQRRRRQLRTHVMKEGFGVSMVMSDRDRAQLRELRAIWRTKTVDERVGVSVAVAPARAPGAPAALSDVARRIPRVTRTLSAAHSALFVHTGGRVGATWFGMPIVVLETVGRRSGRRRTNPVVYLPDGNNLVVVPANAGNPVPPDWWLNLRAAGECVAVVGGQRRRFAPREASGAERARLWRQFAGRTPVEHYQALTPYRIPVVVLMPVR